VVAFGAVLAAFLVALAVQLSGLREMEATFAEMRDHEEQMVLALRLEDAARELYAHALRYARGDVEGLGAYERSRALALELGERLAARVDEPEVTAWVAGMRAAGEEFDRRFRLQVMPASARGEPGAEPLLEGSYGLVALMDRNVDLVISRLQASAAHCRRVLADLEARAVRFTFVLVAGSPIFVAAVVLLVSRSVARPLARLSEGAAAIAAGDLTKQIDVRTPDEFGALAAEFNAMTAALAQHHRRLVESEKLAGIGRLAAGIAHELNNPLQVMLGYLTLHRDPAEPDLRRHLAAVEAETLRCRDIVEGLRELTRPAAEAVDVDLRALCEDAASRLRAAVGGATRVRVQGDARAVVDPQRLAQVVFNLLKNAVEAAGPEGDVGVAIAASSEDVAVAVRDSGAGVTCDARARLFEPFFTTKPAGTGLGLAVSRAIVRAHGGDIDVANGDTGGAVFTVRLPRSSIEGRPE
jgi:signal transduction histidine kinase